MSINKKELSERDICTKFITPALVNASWDIMTQVLEEFLFTKGRVIVRGQLPSRGEAKRADYLLSHKPGIPLAIIEAKDNNHSVEGKRAAADVASLQSMKYQLVLQWPASSIKDYDAMIEIENTLIDNLSTANDVDGHDAGAGEINIFIRTDDPERSFGEIKAILGARDFWVDARVASREVAGSEYTILWPEDLTEFKVA